MCPYIPDTNEKRKRGRPVGSGKKEAVMRNWQPKEFTVEYEAIVIGSCRGISNKQLAQMFGKGEVQIGNILNCVAAREMMEKIRNNLPTAELTEVYKTILELSTRRLEAFVKNDAVFEKYPVAAVDRAMKAMEMIDARLRAKSNENQTNNTLILASEENVERLLRGLAKSKESDRLHGVNNGAAENLRDVAPVRLAG